jgi:two-component system cell cycle response regulator
MENLRYAAPPLKPTHGGQATPLDLSAPVEIAERIWWVGSMHRDETFQCHPYLIEAGEDSVLIDPGSALSIDATLKRVAEIVPIDHIRWIVCHHSDPDIAGGLVRLGEVIDRADATLVTEWRAETLLRYYGHRFPVMLVEDHDWALPLPDGRALQFVLTPYLHFPGAMCSYEPSTRVLFSSDLFGGFTDGSSLIATDSTHFDAIRSFHEHYMPSREILAAGLARIRRAFPDIDLIAPQHGCVIPHHLVDEMFTRMAELECGIFLLARDDLDVARLLRVSSVMRRITDALVMAHDLPELAATTERVLPDLLPVVKVEFYVETPDQGWLCFSRADQWAGTTVPALADQVEPNLGLTLPGDGPRAIVLVTLSEPADITHELSDLFQRLGPALRVALDRHIATRTARLDQEQLYERSRHDPLTGLYNRRKLDDLGPMTGRCGVLMIDIDHFKHVNDEFGHDAGDEVLQHVAGSITRSIRTNDIAIRHGGEEFLVLLDEAEGPLAQHVAERILTTVRAIDAAHLAPGVQVTVSIGVAVHDGTRSLAATIAAADAALYDAKNSGRDRIAHTPVS